MKLRFDKVRVHPSLIKYDDSPNYSRMGREMQYHFICQVWMTCFGDQLEQLCNFAPSQILHDALVVQINTHWLVVSLTESLSSIEYPICQPNGANVWVLVISGKSFGQNRSNGSKRMENKRMKNKRLRMFRIISRTRQMSARRGE